MIPSLETLFLHYKKNKAPLAPSLGSGYPAIPGLLPHHYQHLVILETWPRLINAILFSPSVNRITIPTVTSRKQSWLISRRPRVRPRQRSPRDGLSAGTSSTRNGKTPASSAFPTGHHPHPLQSNLTIFPISRFYVNSYTKKSQWDKPTEPARPPPPDDGAPAGPPPSYTPGNQPAPSDAKVNPYDDPKFNSSNNNASSSSSHHNPQQEDEDARLARQLQAEEDARARGSASASPYPPPGSGQQSPFPGQLPPRPDTLDRGKSGGGFLGKIFGGKKPGSSGGHGSGGALPGALGGIVGAAAAHGSHGGHGQQYGGYPGGHSPAPPQGYGGYPPPQGYGGYPPQHGGYYPPQQGGYYPPQQQYGGYGGGYGGHGGGFAGGQKKSSGGGMGMAMGGAALGVGAGLVGGALIADAIHDGQEDAYQDGFGE